MLLADSPLDLAGLAALGKKKKFKFDFKKKGPIAAMKALAPGKVMKLTRPLLKAGPIKGAKALFGKDEKSKALRKQARTAYVETVMKSQAALSPSFEKHYAFEQRRARVKALQTEAATTTDPERLRQIEAELAREAREQQKYLQGGKAVAAIFSIVGTVFPVLQLVSAAITLGVRAITAQDQKNAEKQLRFAEERAVKEMIAQGLSDGQARQVIALLKSGVDAQTALSSVLHPAGPYGGINPGGMYTPIEPEIPMKHPVYTTLPVPSPEPQVFIKNGASLAPDESMARFLSWLKGWRPEYYQQLVMQQPELLDVAAGSPTSLSGYDDWGHYDDLAGLGEINWGAIIDGVSGAVSAIGKTYFDTQMMKAQIEQVKRGQAPLPTAQAQQVAQQRTTAAGQATGMPSWVMPVGLGAGALFLGFLLFGSGRRG